MWGWDRKFVPRDHGLSSLGKGPSWSSFVIAWQKSVPQDHRLSSLGPCRLMTNSDHEGQIFLSQAHTNKGFFFLLILKFAFSNYRMSPRSSWIWWDGTFNRNYQYVTCLAKCRCLIVIFPTSWYGVLSKLRLSRNHFLTENHTVKRVDGYFIQMSEFPGNYL